MVDTEGGDTGGKGRRDDIGRIIGSSHSDFKNRRIDLGEGRISQKSGKRDEKGAPSPEGTHASP